jgi:hypothetical protein
MLPGVLVLVWFAVALLVLCAVGRRHRGGKRPRHGRQADGPSTKVFEAGETPPSFFDAPTAKMVVAEPDPPRSREAS